MTTGHANKHIQSESRIASDNSSTGPQEFFIDKTEVAARLQLTPRSVELWMRRGLPHYKVGSRRTRFRWPEVEQFMEKRFAGGAR